MLRWIILKPPLLYPLLSRWTCFDSWQDRQRTHCLPLPFTTFIFILKDRANRYLGT
jgi:hypothetical protein